MVALVPVEQERIFAEVVVEYSPASFLSANSSSAAGSGAASDAGPAGETLTSWTAVPLPGGAVEPVGHMAMGCLVALVGRFVVVADSSSTAAVAYATALGCRSGDHIDRGLMAMRWTLESWSVVCDR